MAKENEVIKIKTANLDFDPENPRFYRLNDEHPTDEAVIEEMLDDEGVQFLMDSIGQKGYFEGEPLLVVKSPDAKDNYVVVEGNRRLAATKLLNKQLLPPKRRQNSVTSIIDDAIVAPPTELPCLEYTERKDILRYLGYRHITGIKQWNSLSKARYLSDLREQFYSGQDLSEQLRGLAKDIGSKSGYVGQLLTALSLYTTAENKKFFRLQIEAKDIEFSYITTALNYQEIRSWLGLSARTDIEALGLVADNLEKAFAWMFVKDQQGRTILGETRKLRELAAVVKSPEAIVVLEKTSLLSEAFLYTDGPESALEKAFQEALEKTKNIYKMLPEAKLTSNHASLADSLFDEVKSVRLVLQSRLED